MNSNRQYNTKAIYDLCLSLDLVKKEQVPYTIFYTIIREFHKAIAEGIIFKTYSFKPSEIGIFHVLRDERRGKSINWQASKKRKQEIINSGGIPYSKLGAPHGLEWFVYHEGDYFKWNWYKDKGASFIKNLKKYTFKVATGNRRAVAKAVKSNTFASIDYGIRR